MVRKMLPAKLSARRVGGAVARQRLFAQMDAARHSALTWIDGPAGCGKTTLVATWLALGRRRALWYRVDDGDADPSTIFAFLAQGVAALVSRMVTPLPLATPEVMPDLPGFTRHYFRLLFAALPRSTVLVFDAAEQTRGMALQALLTQAMECVPPGQRIVVTSREATPAAWAPQRIDGRLSVLTWPELRLDDREALSIAGEAAAAHREQVLSLHGLCSGWAAGFALGLDRLKSTGKLVAPASVWTQERLFPYFASELLAEVDDDAQSLLLHTALLPLFTAEQAANLVPGINAGAVLGQLYRRHLLLDRSDTEPPSYRYHDLFRAFLLQQGREVLEPTDREVLLHRAAELLEASAQPEDAAPLWAEAQQWQRVATLWCRLAQGLLAQGRHRPLEEGLEALPKDVLDSHPWARCWLGIAKAPRAPRLARNLLETAFRTFFTNGDYAPALLACASIVETYQVEWNDFSPIDRWAEAMRELLFDRGYEFPVEIEARALSTTYVLAARSRRHLALVDAMAVRAESLLASVSDPKLRFVLALSIMNVLNFRGDWRRGMQLADQLRREADFPAALPPQFVVVWYTWCATHELYGGSLEVAIQQFERAHQFGLDNHLRTFDAMLAFATAMTAMQIDDVDRAGFAIRKLRAAADPERRLGLCQLAVAEAIVSTGQQDKCRDATVLLHHAVQLGSDGGSEVTDVVAGLPLAGVLIDCHDYESGLRALDRAFACAEAYDLDRARHSIQLLRAWAALRQGHESAAIASLREALVLGRACSYTIPFPWVPPALLQELGPLALREGIEPELMRDMLRRRRIPPPTPDADPWPWPLRVRTLGGFELTIDDQPWVPAAKVPKKPLELLKALVALGGRDVSLSVVLDALWPEQDGAAAHNAFNVALHRLRRLLGDEQAVQLHDGRLRLHPQRVWTDVAALEHMAGQVTEGEPQVLATRLLALYRGPFLDGEAAPWAATMRERQRQRFARTAQTLAERMQRQGATEPAIALLRAAAEADPLAEPVHRALIVALQAQDRQAEALQAYHRCRDVLERELGIPPSAATRNLVGGAT